MKGLLIWVCAFALLHTSKNEEAQNYKAPGRVKINEIVLTTTKLLDQMWKSLSNDNQIEKNENHQLEILNFFAGLNADLKEIEETISKSDFRFISDMWLYAQVDSGLMSIDSYYDTFKRFQNETQSGREQPPLAWTDLAETFSQSNDFGLSKILDKLHRQIRQSDPINLFQLAIQENTRMICEQRLSPHQMLYNLYNTIAMADYKGYIMLQFSYMILKLYNKGDFTNEAKHEKEKFEKRIKEMSMMVRDTLANTKRSLYNCDPKQYVEGVNYVTLTKLLQGYIENEVNLNSEGTCRENCAYYQYTDYHGCYKDQFCGRQDPCRGKVVECKYVDSDMNICKSTDPSRRYDWIEYENGNVLGNKGRCLNRNLFKVDSWWRYLFWHCSYCLCLCDAGNFSSDRYFNLRSVTSDIQENKVITGVKIIKYNKIIHLQIQQGKLLPRGFIDKSTTSWKPVDNYTLHDHNVESGIDYHTMSYIDRAFDIDEISGPDEHVLTGVRFRKLGNHLNLEIRITPIDFITGKVSDEVLSTWIGNDNTEVNGWKPRQEIVLTNPDIPIRNGHHAVESEHDMFIKFRASSFDHDAAQTTVPYLDANPVLSSSFPLSGFGFVYRGRPGSGGFIAPKLITYNYSPHIWFDF